MAQENDNFSLKEFLVGLVIVGIIFFLIVSGLKKISRSSLLKNLSFKKAGQAVQLTKDYCKDTIYADVKKDQSIGFERLIKRVGWQDVKTKYNLTLQNPLSNKLMLESVFGDIKEKDELTCGEFGISYVSFDKWLLAGFFNSPQDKLADFLDYKILEKEITLLTNNTIQTNIWTNKLTLKGAAYPTNITLQEGERVCFLLDVLGNSERKVAEKITTGVGELEAVKVETVWEATASALLQSFKKSEDCQTNNDYDSTLRVKFKDEVWFAPGLGIVKRHLTPLELTGPAYFLPNGYVASDLTDTVISK